MVGAEGTKRPAPTAVSDAIPNPSKRPKSGEQAPPATPNSANTEVVRKNLLSDISKERPNIPIPPNFEESVMGVNGNKLDAQAREYFEEVEICARYLVTEWVSKPCSEGGLNILQPLCCIPPLKISDNSSSSSELTRFSETWDAPNCASALRSTALYEALGSIWWASRKKKRSRYQLKNI